MQLSKALSLLATATAALARNRLTFISMDENDRTVYFTPSVPHAWLDPIRVEGFRQVSTNMPNQWIGNVWSVTDGAPIKPGMLGEVAFQGYEDKTFFDVSAIVDAHDHDGVHVMYPAEAKSPRSGCEMFPCPHAYYLPDDVQTKVTPEFHIITTLGGQGKKKRDYDSDSDWDWDSDWDSDSDCDLDSDSDSDCDSDDDSDGEYMHQKRSVDETFPHGVVLGLWAQN
ncbi:hypothetical protein QBC34DRAFT_221288 [Podospora aff. communis PSN243]|uniref:DNase1 protein n=1 Tax=Podospora aff. communis PSN243 TaxID=3040156 RepID=A0AAV9GZM0_9PEZI|nr:hypothetical protein QBC34DRAFT_221288 [Podospora aff. communis PSN243]